jgi:hypothetical protein
MILEFLLNYRRIFSNYFSDIYLGINNGGDLLTPSSSNVQHCRFNVFLTTECRLHLSIEFIASNATSAIWISSATRSLSVLSRTATYSGHTALSGLALSILLLLYKYILTAVNSEFNLYIQRAINSVLTCSSNITFSLPSYSVSAL